jgi:cytochrome c oxidase subunit 2
MIKSIGGFILFLLTSTVVLPSPLYAKDHPPPTDVGIDERLGGYVPAFRVKEDVVPGMERTLWFTAEEQGTYNLFCTEYCGPGHSLMLARVMVTLEEEFEKWLKPETSEVTKTGLELIKIKGCIACHSTDGSPLIGPTFKGVFGRKSLVLTEGKEREVRVDEGYIRRSILEPEADLVKGFPPVMPSQEGVLTAREIEAIIEYLKTLK